MYKCEIISINDNNIELRLDEKQDINTELPQHITICSGLIKADKYEWMIQKATEMGARVYRRGNGSLSRKLNESKVAKK